MPYSRPTLAQLVNQTRADFLARAQTNDPLRLSDLDVQARVASGAVSGLYGYADWIAKQILPDTADTDVLDRYASIWLSVPRKPAAPATGSVSFTAQAGAVVLAGTQVRALDGQVYATTADAAGTAPTLTAPVQAVTPGAAGSRDAGQVMTLVNPVLGVQSTVTAGAMSGGADVETDDDLRTRLLQRIKSPPQGGSKDDYIAWALEVPGVTRAWCYPGEQGARSVIVRFVRDNDATIAPDAGEIAAVQAHIDAVRPVTDQAVVLAPILSPVAFNISGLVPNTTAVQAAVAAELADLLKREAQPGGGILLTHIRAAISQASGETDYTLVAPAANVLMGTGYMASMGAITWS